MLPDNAFCYDALRWLS